MHCSRCFLCRLSYLTASTRYSLQKIIHICEVCAEEFKIRFHGTNGKRMVCGMDANDMFCECVSGDDVDCVNRID